MHGLYIHLLPFFFLISLCDFVDSDGCFWLCIERVQFEQSHWIIRLKLDKKENQNLFRFFFSSTVVCMCALNFLADE